MTSLFDASILPKVTSTVILMKTNYNFNMFGHCNLANGYK